MVQQQPCAAFMISGDAVPVSYICLRMLRDVVWVLRIAKADMSHSVAVASGACNSMCSRQCVLCCITCLAVSVLPGHSILDPSFGRVAFVLCCYGFICACSGAGPAVLCHRCACAWPTHDSKQQAARWVLNICCCELFVTWDVI